MPEIVKKHWREYLDIARDHWMADRTGEAIAALAEAVELYPDEPLPRIQKYYFEHSLHHRDKAAAINFPERKPGDPKVSVLMGTYNRTRWIRQSIESMIDQKLGDWELIIVNDGGADEVEEIVNSYEEPRIKYLWKEHEGLCPALNLALRNARGKYVSFLDDDDIYYPEHLADLVEAMDANPGAVIGYTGYVNAIQEKIGSEYFIVERKIGRRRLADRTWDRELLKWRNFVNTIPAMARRDAIAKSGGFNETLTYCVHWDLWIRLSAFGDVIPVEGNSCEYRWREDGTNMSTDKKFRRVYFDNVFLSMHKGIIFDSKTLVGKNGEAIIRGLKTVLNDHPEAIRAVDIRKLLAAGKPYHYFQSLAEEYVQSGERKGASTALKAATRAAPYELKLWVKRIAPMSLGAR